MNLIEEFKKHCAEQEGLDLEENYVKKVYLGENKDFYPDEFVCDDIVMSGKNRFYNYYGFCIMKAAVLAGRDENEIEIFVDISVDYTTVAVVDMERGKLVRSYAGKPRHFRWDSEAALAARLLAVIEAIAEKMK